MKKIVVLGSLILSAFLYGKDYTKYKTTKLISATEAKELIEKDKNVVLIDVRPSAKFMLSNVEGSYNFWRPDMEPKDNRYGEIGGMRASREEMEKELNKMGVTKNSTIVLTGDGIDEYRLWWILDLYGMENVKVVDGGYDALKETGIKTGVGRKSDEKKGDYKFPKVKDKDSLATLETVKTAIKNPKYVIIDTRSLKEYKEKRVPNSKNIDYKESLDADGKFKSYEELIKIYNEKGVTKDKISIPYCQVGVKSAHTTFVLKELLGYRVKNYDGSLAEWSYEAKKGDVKLEIGEDK